MNTMHAKKPSYPPSVGLDAQFDLGQYEKIEVEPITGALGAEIRGVNLADPLSEETVAEIRQALLNHLVIFFHDQDITPDQHIEFGRRFGEIYFNKYIPGMTEHPEINLVKKEADDIYNFGGARWHSDGSYRECPPLGAILLAREVPIWGGDTMFCNMYLAYETLSDGMKKLLKGLISLHSAEKVFGPDGYFRSVGTIMGAEDQTPDQRLPKTVEHPVVRTHPETGCEALYVSKQYTLCFKDMSEEESKPLLDYLVDHATAPGLTCRVRWKRKSIVFWDNRCTMHFPLNDYRGQRRVMHRLTIQGDRPF